MSSTAAFTLDDAIVLAATAHHGQRDKAGQPYICHPLRVMARLGDDTLRIIAVLHDVVEDTNLTLDDLRDRGASLRILDALDALTHRPGEPNRQYWARIAANPDAVEVKDKDIDDNSDEDRLALLDVPEAARLRRKYDEARTAIHS